LSGSRQVPTPKGKREQEKVENRGRIRNIFERGRVKGDLVGTRNKD
jgi:hypothetical protein